MNKERAEILHAPTTGVIFVVEQDGLFLVEKRPETNRKYGGFTIVPGGKVEAGEDTLQTLFREMHEELDIKADSFTVEPMERVNYFAPDGALSVCETYFVKILKGFSARNCEPEKGEHIWLKPDEALDKCELAVSKYIISLAQKKLNEARPNKG